MHRRAHGQESKACPYNLNSAKIHHKSEVQRSHTTPPAVKCDGAACTNLSEHTAGPAHATECSWESGRETVLLNHFHTELPSLGTFQAQRHFQDSAITKTHFLADNIGIKAEPCLPLLCMNKEQGEGNIPTALQAARGAVSVRFLMVWVCFPQHLEQKKRFPILIPPKADYLPVSGAAHSPTCQQVTD